MQRNVARKRRRSNTKATKNAPEYDYYHRALVDAVLKGLHAVYPVPAETEVSPLSEGQGHHIPEIEEWRLKQGRNSPDCPHTPSTPLGLAAGMGAALALEAVKLEGPGECAKAAKVIEVHRRFLVALEPGVRVEMLLDMQSLYNRIQAPIKSLKAEFEAAGQFTSHHLSALQTYEYAIVLYAGIAGRTLELSEDREESVRSIRRDLEESVAGYCAALHKWADYVVQAVALRSNSMGGSVKRVDVYHPSAPQSVTVEARVEVMRNFPDRQWNALETMTNAARDHVRKVVSQKMAQLALVLEPFSVNIGPLKYPHPTRMPCVTYLWRHSAIPGVSHQVQDLRAEGMGAGKVKLRFL
eukprot:Hpha_TRINITY_DN14627_c0_g2::TRINITY_DN14627_c0_g2_i1::g.48037::m.48037